MRGKISRRRLDSAKLQRGRDLWIWDGGAGACPGFYARHLGREGSRWRYAVKYRQGAASRHHLIGEDGGAIPADVAQRLGLEPGATWTPEAARREAERIRGLVREGRDPDAGREVPTFGVFAERFMREHLAEPLRKARTVEEYQGLLDRHLLPAFKDRRLDKIDQAAVTRFVHTLKARPVTANRALAVLSSIYSRAVSWGVVPAGSNPARGVPRFREAKRERFLSAGELQRLGAALLALEAEGKADPAHAVSPFAIGAIRLLMFTGMRPGEALALRWEHVDLERGILSLPDSKTGAKAVHLSAPASLLLSKLPRLADDGRVFPPHKKGAREADLESAWRRVRERAELADVRLYDACRHSFASLAVAGGASLYITGALLGHKKASTTQRYAHLSADPLRAVADKVGAQLAAAFAAPKPKRDNVAEHAAARQRRRARR